MSLLVACEPSSTPCPADNQTATKTSVPVVVDPDLISLSDGNMDRSTAFRIDGDLRPLWIVSGRIRNNSATELRSVILKISIISKASSIELDTAQLTVDADFPPDSAVSFKRTVQLLPPSSGWGWTWSVVKAVPQ